LAKQIIPSLSLDRSGPKRFDCSETPTVRWTKNIFFVRVDFDSTKRFKPFFPNLLPNSTGILAEYHSDVGKTLFVNVATDTGTPGQNTKEDKRIG